MIVEYSVAHGVYNGPIASVQRERKLEDEVNRMIQDGWQPFGSLVVSDKGDTVVFIQPMVRTSGDLSGVGAGVVRQVDEGYFG